MVATTAFEEAAKAQSAALNFDPAIVYVHHPIQDRTDDEIKDIARDALEPVLKMISATDRQWCETMEIRLGRRR